MADQAVRLAGTSITRPPVSTADADTYGSSSTLSAETTTGSYVLTVPDYSLEKDLHVAGWALPYLSNTFTVGGCSWRMRYSHDEDWICFGLCLQPTDAGAGATPGIEHDGAMVRIRYSLLDQAGQPVPSSVKIESERALSDFRLLRYTQYMKRKRFEVYYVKDNSFSVRCDVTLVTRTCRLSGPPPDLRRHLLDLLVTGVGADVTLEVGGEAFAVHRTVLGARSPVFRAELFGGLSDDKDVAPTRRMSIPDIEPSVLKALLYFIYTDTFPEMDAGEDRTVMARHLLVAAQRYGLQGLKWICEDVLCISCPRGVAKQLSPST